MLIALPLHLPLPLPSTSTSPSPSPSPSPALPPPTPLKHHLQPAVWHGFPAEQLPQRGVAAGGAPHQAQAVPGQARILSYQHRGCARTGAAGGTECGST